MLEKKYYDGMQIHDVLCECLDDYDTILTILEKFASLPSADVPDKNVGDLIRRADAVDVVDAIWATTGDVNVAKAWDQIKDLPSAEPHWIPVTEQTLPRHNSIVVVCGNKGTWDYGTYRGHTTSNINLWNWKKNTLKEVHWWMYKEDALPKPWKGGVE